MTISASTTLSMVWGDPIAHSLSPRLHNAAYEAVGLSGHLVMVAARVNERELARALDAARIFGVAGLAVTMPLKERIIPLLDDVDPFAARVGSVNTVVNRKGKLIGFNTDIDGILEPLRTWGSLGGVRALVLGAGGAGRAAVLGLQEEGASVTVANRSLERGEALDRDFNCDFRPLGEIENIDEYSLVVNATPLGMSERDYLSPLPKHLFRPEKTLFEMVYRPAVTPLVADALEGGARVIDGLEMFLHQAITQFELHSGKVAPREVMRQVLEEARRS